MPSVSFVLDHTRLDKSEGSTEGEQCTIPADEPSNRIMKRFVKPILTTAARLKTLRKLSRSNRGVRVTDSLVPVLVTGVSNPLVDPIIRGKLQSVLSVTDRTYTILICQKTM